MNDGIHVNVGVFVAFCLKRQAEQGPEGVFLGALIIRILKNLGLFPVRVPSDYIGSSLTLKVGILRDWNFMPAGEEVEEEDLVL